ncbi:MAG: tRNA (N(6)-L-threonylcarbamoyladenosine(37)-C(2))-methylthiotransferase [Nanoarchaeota archaeon]
MTNVHITTYGCAFNKQDSEIMAGLLKEAGYNLVDSENDADVVIINSCTVKNTSETKFFKQIRKLQKQNKKIVAAGCIPQAEPSYLNTKLKDISVIGINEFDKVVEIVENVLKGNTLQYLTDLKLSSRKEYQAIKEKIRFLSPKLRETKLTEILPINEGCLSNCKYCKTKQSRGNLFSFSPGAIKKRMEFAISEGVKEIYLTSQDIACYGIDIGTNLVELLKELTKIPGDYKIRLGMGNPKQFIPIIDDLLNLMEKEDRIYKFLHIPMQSGSNRILKEMNRGNTVEEYMTIVTKIKNRFPDLTLANDIIVAYPTETDDEFRKTLLILKKSQTDVLNYSRFWLRPNTPAESYTKSQFIIGGISKDRSKEIRQKFESQAFKQNTKWIGWMGEVLVSEMGKEGTNSIIARNYAYKPIILKNKEKKLKIGDKIKVKITDCTWFDFKGKIII